MDSTTANAAACSRKLVMVAVDGGVNKLLKKFGSFRCCAVTGKTIIDALVEKKFAFSIYVSSNHDDYSKDGKPIVAKFRTSGKKLAVILGPLVADESHKYCVCFNDKCLMKCLAEKHNTDLDHAGSGENINSRFIMLPVELKIRILELLSGVDLAKIGCVCSEMRDLTSNDDLWRRKYLEEKLNKEEIGEESLWKQKFAKALKRRRNWKKISTPMCFQFPHGARVHPNEYLYFLLDNL